jgi:uncharacterized protein YecE (DUF72 family)
LARRFLSPRSAAAFRAGVCGTTILDDRDQRFLLFIAAPEFYARWYDETPADFVFSVKGPRFVTHMLKLRNVEQALANFFASGIANLREKLGPFLWQLPPILSFDNERLERFFELLPRDNQ